MSWVQCIACMDLRRDVRKVEGTDLVVYECGRGRFPYLCALSGLEKPSQGIARAADRCELFDRQRCVVCGKQEGLTTMMGEGLLSICHEHSQAWDKWLDSHREKREYFCPGSRVISSRWLETFLEFAAEQKATPAAAGPESPA